MRPPVFSLPGTCLMWKRLLAAIGVLLLAGLGLFGWERWQQSHVTGRSDEELVARKGDQRAIRERIKRAEVREDPASGAAAWVELSLARPQDPLPLLRASLAWEAASQPTNAYSVLNQAYNKWPKDIRVLQARAAFFERQRDRPQAVKTFHEWLQVEPGSVDAHLRLADALYAAGVLEDASEHYQAALARDPGLDSPRRRVALIQLLRGETEPALKSTNALLAGSNPEGITHQLKAEIELAQRGKEAVASVEEDLQLALVRDPGLASSMYLFGLVKELKGDYSQAAAQYRRLLSRDPFHRGGTHRLAKVLDRLGDPKNAEALQLRHRQLAKAHGEAERLTASLSASPGDTVLSLQLARAYRTLGRLQDAMSAYGQVLQARPNDAALQREVQPLLQQRPAPGRTEDTTQP